MAKTKRLNGWMYKHRNNKQDIPISDEPTKWENMLYDLGVIEENAVEALNENGDRSILIREWVRKNYQNFFVPEGILEICGIDGRWV